MVNSMSGGPMSRGMMRMMGMGDMANAVNNVDEYMPQGMEKIQTIAMQAQRDAVARGKDIFNDTDLGNSGLSCNSCHPNGATTGGTVPLPMRAQYKIRIPDLHGAAATFPKFKVPSGAVISLEQMNNNCTRMFVMGSHLSEEESNALAAYVASLDGGN